MGWSTVCVWARHTYWTRSVARKNQVLLHNGCEVLRVDCTMLHNDHEVLHANRAMLHDDCEALHANRAALHVNREMVYAKRAAVSANSQVPEKHLFAGKRSQFGISTRSLPTTPVVPFLGEWSD
jgi:hypothetical protein